jgi:hypothetical protein
MMKVNRIEKCKIKNYKKTYKKRKKNKLIQSTAPRKEREKLLLPLLLECSLEARLRGED